MKFFFILHCSLLLFAAEITAQDTSKPKKPQEMVEQYWFVLLKTGLKQDFDSTTKAKLFQGHMANINKLYYDGILKVAGPFGKNDLTWRGIFIFDCKTREEAVKLANEDPAVAAGLFAIDVVPWYGLPIGSFTHGKPAKPKE